MITQLVHQKNILLQRRLNVMTNYYISAVHYNSENTRIEQLEVLLVPSSPKSMYNLDIIDNAEKSWKSRKHIVSQIANNNSEYFTVYLSDSGKHYESGTLVNAIQIDGDYFLKTDKNEEKKDNLGDLPRK
ncbi:MAG: DUF3892 domain-containing protein [Candidatus Electrothrix sp. AX5]|nr:DUF3892 domain-containing protein [Candidatus Electrothrix sp. AX5]